MSLNIGFITWIIKKDDFRKFHNCKIGDFMISEEVTTQGMQWYMKCYPNGSKHKTQGWVGLSLTLKKSSIPDNITNVLVRYYLYESQSSSISRGIARFNNNNNDNNNNNGNNDDNNNNNNNNNNNSIIGYAKANGTNYLVELDELKKYDIIILKCEFEIIRMYRFNRIIYGYPLRLNKIISYEWNISNKILDKFKEIENPYTRLYSSEFNIYNLVLIPCATTYNSKGNISLRLRLYELPPIISSIKIIIVLSCKQFNKEWTSITNLSYGESWISWPNTTLKKSIVDENLFDEQTNNKQSALKCLSFQCKIEILSITLYKLNNLHNLEITDKDTKYRNIWNKYVMDDNNIFMAGTNMNNNNNNNNNDDTKQDDEYQITNEYQEDDDEYLICKKEDFIRMNILKSLDLNDEQQKKYLMNTVYSMNENIRILRKEKEQNTKMLKQLQTMMHSMQKNMKSMKHQIESLTKKKTKDNDNENFIKRMKKEKAKRDKVKDKDDGSKKKSKQDREHKKKKKSKRKSSTDIIDNSQKQKQQQLQSKQSKIIEINEIDPEQIKKGLTAKQQLFKTWMDMVVHLPQYFQLFVDAGYEDLTYIENMQLTEQDLIQIGIEKRGHRQKILQEIKKMSPKINDNNNDNNTIDTPNIIINNTNNNNNNNNDNITNAEIGDNSGIADELFLGDINNPDVDNDVNGDGMGIGGGGW